MSVSRIVAWFCGVAAVVFVASQVAAQGPPKIPKEKISSAGEIKAIQQGVFHVKNIGGDEWFIRVEAMPKDIVMKGSAAANWLRAGMPVEFSGEFKTNRKGEPLGHAQKPIAKLKVSSPREDPQKKANIPAAANQPAAGVSKAPKRGSFLVGTAPKEEKAENTSAFTVSGMLKIYKGGRMTVTTGQTTYTAELAEDVKISVDIADPRFARVGDEFEFDGWHYPGQKKYIHATKVWITASKPLGDEKKVRRVTSKSSRGPTADQRRAITQLQSDIDAANNLYNESKIKEAVGAVKEIQATMDKLAGAGNAGVIRLLKTQYTKLRGVHAMLEMEGYKMPPLKEPKLESK